MSLTIRVAGTLISRLSSSHTDLVSLTPLLIDLYSSLVPVPGVFGTSERVLPTEKIRMLPFSNQPCPERDWRPTSQMMFLLLYSSLDNPRTTRTGPLSNTTRSTHCYNKEKSSLSSIKWSGLRTKTRRVALEVTIPTSLIKRPQSVSEMSWSTQSFFREKVPWLRPTDSVFLVTVQYLQ